MTHPLAKKPLCYATPRVERGGVGKQFLPATEGKQRGRASMGTSMHIYGGGGVEFDAASPKVRSGLGVAAGGPSVGCST